MSLPLSPLPREGRNSRSLAVGLEARLAERIDGQIYGVGQRLPTEAALVAEFGVSRTVVREAVSRLQAAGLVATRHGIGTFVLESARHASFRVDAEDLATLKDVIAVLELRIAVEAEAAALAAQRRTAADIKRMRSAIKAFERAVSAGQSAIEHDLAFHQAIARATANRRFTDLLSALGEGAIPRARLRGAWGRAHHAPGYLNTIHREHVAIVEAIAAGESEQARRAMRAHLQASRDRREAAMATPPLTAPARSHP